MNILCNFTMYVFSQIVSIIAKIVIVYFWIKWLVIPISATFTLLNFGIIHAICIVISLNVIYFVSPINEIFFNIFVEQLKTRDYILNKITIQNLKIIIIILAKIILFSEIFIISLFI